MLRVKVLSTSEGLCTTRRIAARASHIARSGLSPPAPSTPRVHLATDQVTSILAGYSHDTHFMSRFTWQGARARYGAFAPAPAAHVLASR